MSQRVAGIISFKIDGEMYNAKGAFTYGLGKPVRESIVGQDRHHGYKEMPTAAFIEGDVTDTKDLSADAFAGIVDSTVTLDLANGKTIVLRNAFNTNKDGHSVQTEDGVISVRFEGTSAEEIA